MYCWKLVQVVFNGKSLWSYRLKLIFKNRPCRVPPLKGLHMLVCEIGGIMTAQLSSCFG